MKPAVEKLLTKYYGGQVHAFQVYERLIAERLSEEATVLDAGCGATAPVLKKLAGKCRKQIGVDLGQFAPTLQQGELQLLQNDLSHIDLPSGSVDVVISRSVLEHIDEVESVYRELHRVLKPGGSFIILVPNLWDYVSVISYLTPNRFHQYLVERAAGRPTGDTFATFYKSNSRGSIRRLAARNGFSIASFQYLGQFPYMFEFNPLLFRLGIYYDKLVCRFEQLDFLRGWILCEMVKEH